MYMPIVVCSQSISGVGAVNFLVAFYNIHGRKKGVILLFCPEHHTKQEIINWRKTEQKRELALLTVKRLCSLTTRSRHVLWRRKKKRGPILLLCPEHHTRQEIINRRKAGLKNCILIPRGQKRELT
jgi:hypothetical protein